jgi:hypothetical protein
LEIAGKKTVIKYRQNTRVTAENVSLRFLKIMLLIKWPVLVGGNTWLIIPYYIEYLKVAYTKSLIMQYTVYV